MPAWWGKKSSKNKEEKHQQLQQDNKEASNGKNDILNINKKKKSSSNTIRDSNNSKRSGSFDEPVRNSPRMSKDFAGGSSGFSGFDSDSVEKRGLGLPLPTPSGSGSDHGITIGLGSGSASGGSVSSVSSSGSSGEDHPIASDHHTNLFNGYRSTVDHRGNGDIRFNMGSRSPGPGSRSPRPGSRSPGPASRGASRSASPLHPLMGGMNLDSPTDGKNQCHPLPLPPGSPTSPPSLPGCRTPVVTESMNVPVSRWKKGKLLGRGTFGHVYLGFNSEGGHMCAIKEVRVVSDDQTSKECLKQLNQEINLLSQLQHPNIVRYYGSELSEETLSVYLEYVSGGSIHKLLQEYGAFKEPVIQNYTRQILSGLAYLHGRNTVHRDIKGANILVDPNGEIKLADFGMAKHITSCSSMLSFKGSPYWMAPEVVMNTNGYNLAVDIWSLGCTILEMATSKPPWNQYEGVAAIFKIGNSKDMPDIPDQLSNEAKSFIKLCLQRDPSARPTASQLLDHPFIRDQATTRAANINITRDAFPFTFDGSRTPPALDLHSKRSSIPLSEGEYAMKPVITNVRGLKNTRDDVRMITSLPVSPCSSPLRQYGPAHKSCFLSPPHPTYALVGQGGYNLSDYSLYSARPNTSYNHDPGFENSLLKGQTPGASPRTRPI
ncbi:mitogen-activated protein kinase kinase kinase 3 isoform X2 [Ricinus communis]|nr:mitogen-activated protein kinase kinase kinase 3 isoform X2 [Ricinus communis]